MLALSSFTPVARLGALLAVTIVAAAVGSLVVLPAFLRYQAARALRVATAAAPRQAGEHGGYADTTIP